LQHKGGKEEMYRFVDLSHLTLSESIILTAISVGMLCAALLFHYLTERAEEKKALKTT